MFQTEVDIEGLSKNATVRWKKQAFNETDKNITKSDVKRLHSLISTSDPKHFLSVTVASANDSVKISNHEDLKEISLQLSILRKKYDGHRDSNYFHDSHISNLKKQLNTFRQDEDKTISRIETLKSNISGLEEQIAEIMKKQEDALEATKIYNHIIERMRVKKQKLDIQNEAIIHSVKMNKKLLTEEIAVCRKRRDSKIKTKKALDVLEDFIEKETKDKQERLVVIESDVKKKQESTQKREERFKRQLEIAESAANEDREMRATQMREGVMMHQFWYLYMKKRLDFDMEKLSPIEKAFETVRKKSNVNNASEMVIKFLSIEIEYNELRRIVGDSNQNIVNTQSKILEIEKALEKAEKLKPQSEYKDSLRNDAVNKLKLVSDTKDKLIKIKQVHEKVTSWLSKIIKKFGAKSNEKGLTANLEVLKNAVIVALRDSKERVMFI